MARRSGLGQRGLDILIPASSGMKQKEQEKKKKKKKPAPAGTSAADAAVTGNGAVTGDAAVTGNAAVIGDAAAPEDSEENGTGREEAADDAAEIQGEPEESYEGVKSYSAEEPADMTLNQAQLEVDINKVEPNRDQPRKQFDDDSLQELASSIRIHGVIQPLIVQKKDDYYEIIAGERRWRAAKLAGLKTVPVLVRDYSDQEVMELSLIENIQRQDLNPIEEAGAYRRLIEEYDLTQDQVAERVSRSRTAVTNSLRLLKLDPRVQDMLISEILSMGHARALLAIEDGDLQFKTAQKAFDEKMSVRDVETYVKKLLKKPAPEKKPAISQQLKTIYNDMEERMKVSLGTKVSILSKNPEKGRIEIEYFSSDELERIYNAILSGHDE